MVFNFDVRAIWRSGVSTRSPCRQTPLLFYVTILAILCKLKGYGSFTSFI